MGQQVLEAGLATQKGYVPLDSQIYVSKKKVLDAKVSFMMYHLLWYHS